MGVTAGQVGAAKMSLLITAWYSHQPLHGQSGRCGLCREGWKRTCPWWYRELKEQTGPSLGTYEATLDHGALQSNGRDIALAFRQV